MRILDFCDNEEVCFFRSPVNNKEFMPSDSASYSTTKGRACNTVFLLLGGNLGEVRRYFEKAEEFISKDVGRIIQASSLYQSEAWGFESAHPFLNKVLVVQTDLPLFDLLYTTQRIEQAIGRKEKTQEDGQYSSRFIDIDILFYNNIALKSRELTVPHAKMHLRCFTMMPLEEIAPKKIHPALNKKLGTLLKDCPDRGLCSRVEN